MITSWVCPQVQDLHDRLNEEWDVFQQKLIDYDQTLQEQKETFKNSLLLSAQDFREKTKMALKDFAQTGHFCCSAVSSVNSDVSDFIRLCSCLFLSFALVSIVDSNLLTVLGVLLQVHSAACLAVIQP